jgi:hypothetical protein
MKKMSYRKKTGLIALVIGFLLIFTGDISFYIISFFTYPLSYLISNRHPMVEYVAIPFFLFESYLIGFIIGWIIEKLKKSTSKS